MVDSPTKIVSIQEGLVPKAKRECPVVENGQINIIFFQHFIQSLPKSGMSKESIRGAAIYRRVIIIVMDEPHLPFSYLVQ